MSCSPHHSLLAVSKEVFGFDVEGLLTPEEEGFAAGLPDEAVPPPTPAFWVPGHGGWVTKGGVKEEVNM